MTTTKISVSPRERWTAEDISFLMSRILVTTDNAFSYVYYNEPKKVRKLVGMASTKLEKIVALIHANRSHVMFHYIDEYADMCARDLSLLKAVYQYDELFANVIKKTLQDRGIIK